MLLFELTKYFYFLQKKMRLIKLIIINLLILFVLISVAVFGIVLFSEIARFAKHNFLYNDNENYI